MLEDNDAIEALESFGRTLDDIDMSVLRKLSKRKCTTDEIQFYGQFLEPLGAFSGSMGVAIGKVVSLSLCELPQRLTKKAYEEEREEISKAIMSATQSALSNYNGLRGYVRLN